MEQCFQGAGDFWTRKATAMSIHTLETYVLEFRRQKLVLGSAENELFRHVTEFQTKEQKEAPVNPDTIMLSICSASQNYMRETLFREKISCAGFPAYHAPWIPLDSHWIQLESSRIQGRSDTATEPMRYLRVSKKAMRRFLIFRFSPTTTVYSVLIFCIKNDTIKL